MKVKHECASCMLRQANEAIEHASPDEDIRMDTILKVLEFMNENFNENVNSNKLGTDLHHLVMEHTHCNDPYKEFREKGNNIAKKMIPSVENMLEENPSLENYVKIAIAGNIIDFGALKEDADMEKAIIQQLNNPLISTDINEFENSLNKAKNILYLADNGGEIVFDKLLIKKLKEDYNLNITLALKEGPILNDALVQDAINLNLDKYATLISTGASSVGVVKDYISDELHELLNTSDLVISKGMGNFEGLTEMNTKSPIYFLLSIKCSAISKEVGLDVGSNALMKRINK